MAHANLPSIYTIRQLLDYDPVTGKLTWLERDQSIIRDPVVLHKWNMRFAGKEAFTYIHKTGYKVGTLCGKQRKSHRVIWAWYYGEWPESDIDHINLNKTDNRIQNLRLASNSENARNKQKYSNNTSGYKGVSFHKASGGFVSRIRLNGKLYHLGLFEDAESASATYQKAMESFHGEFARAFSDEEKSTIINDISPRRKRPVAKGRLK